MKVTILGCGTSSGVPRIGGDWGNCDPSEPKNRRRRVSILIEHDGVAVVVDTGPDFREQALSANITRLHAVLFTHDHADHAHGIDDLRQIYHLMRSPVQCYATPETWAVLARRFDYVFAGTASYPATAVANPLPRVLQFGELRITSFDQGHGNIRSTGYRFDVGDRSCVYSTDIKDIVAGSEEALDALDVWIVDVLRIEPHPTHSHLAQSLGWIERFKPRRAILTHMDQSMDYATLCRTLPGGVEPGYDGLVLDL